MTPTAEELSLLDQIYPVSRETIRELAAFGELLALWQRKTNLVAPSTLPQFWSRHVADSLQCLALKPDARRWIDLGSGGGFPAVPIAIANRGRPTEHHLVESIHKKCAFLREAVRISGANATIHCERIESAAERPRQTTELGTIVTARALASLPRLMAFAEPVFARGAVALFHKGRDFEAELRECDGLWKFDLIVHRSRIEADSVVLEISDASRVAAE